MGVGLTGWRESHDRNFWMVSGLSGEGSQEDKERAGRDRCDREFLRS